MTRSGLFEPPANTRDEVGALAVADTLGDAPIDLACSPAAGTVQSATVPATTPTPEQQPLAGRNLRPTDPTYLRNLNRIEASSPGAVSFSFRTGDARTYGPLHFSLSALSKAASSHDAGDWLDAASALKRDAVRLRNSSGLGRHASVLLTLADALTFTLPSDPTLRPGASQILQRGLSVLTEPFISTDDEKGLMKELLSHGWNIAPASEGHPPAA